MRTGNSRRFRFPTRLLRLEDRITPAITTSLDKLTGALTFTSDAADAIVVVSNLDRDGLVLLNGGNAQDQNGLTIYSSEVASLTIRGTGFGGNLIDVSGMAINQKGTPGSSKAVTTKSNRTLPPVVIDGGLGDDTIIGSPGDDWLNGGEGKDSLFGGAGSDLLVIDHVDEDCDGGKDDSDEVEFVLPPSGGVSASLKTEWITSTGVLKVSVGGVVRLLPGVEILTPVPPSNEPNYKLSTSVHGDFLPAHNFKIEIDGVVATGNGGGGGGGGSGGAATESFSLNFTKIEMKYREQNELVLGGGDDTVTITPGPTPWSIDGGAGLDQAVIDTGGYSYTQVGNEVRVATKATVTMTNFDSAHEFVRIYRDGAAVADLSAKGITVDYSMAELGQTVGLTWKLTNTSPILVDSFSWGITQSNSYKLGSGLGTGKVAGASVSPGVTVSVGTSPTGATTEEIVAGVAVPKFLDYMHKAASIGPGTTVSGTAYISKKMMGQPKIGEASCNLRIGTDVYTFTLSATFETPVPSAVVVVSVDGSTGKSATDAGSNLVGASADGSVVLTSSSSQQLAPDGNPGMGLHLYAAGLLVDATATGATANGSVGTATIDAPGRFVAFLSTATNLVGVPDTNGGADVFLRDLWTGTTTLVSGGYDTLGGFVAGNNVSRKPYLCADGSCVVFESKASDLIPGLVDTNNDWDLFRYDVATGALECVSLSANGAGGLSTANGGSNLQGVSADGSLVVWFTTATDLTNPPSSGPVIAARQFDKSSPQLFLKVCTCKNAYVSGDGGTVVFTSNEDLSAYTGVTDTNGVSDLFRWTPIVNKVDALSVDVTGAGMGDGPTPADPSDRVAVSFDGSVVVCDTGASNLFSISGRGIGGWDLAKGKKARLAPTSTSSGGTSSPSLPTISHDGRVVIWQSYVDMENAASPPLSVTQVWSLHIASGQVDNVSGNRVANNPLYQQGNTGGENPFYTSERVLFSSSSNNLSPDDPNSLPDVYGSVNDRTLIAFAPTGAVLTNEMRLFTSSSKHRILFDDKSGVALADRDMRTVDYVLVAGSSANDQLTLDTSSGLTGISSGLHFLGDSGSDTVITTGSGSLYLFTGDMDKDGHEDLLVSQPGLHFYAFGIEGVRCDGPWTEAPFSTDRTFVFPHVFEKSGSISSVKYDIPTREVKVHSSPTSGVSATFVDTLSSSSVTLASFGSGLKLDTELDLSYVRDRKDMLQWYCDASLVTSPVRIYGGDCDDTIKGGQSADLITFGGGSDSIDGGSGVDTYAVKPFVFGHALIVVPSDNVDLSAMTGGVTINVGTTAPQIIAPGVSVQLSATPRSFKGTDCDDSVTMRTFVLPHVLESKGGYDATTGDTLTFDAEGLPVAAFGGKIYTPGKATVEYSEYESLVVVNNAASPQVAVSLVNNGDAQRSRVEVVTVAFNSLVTISNPTAAFHLENKFGTSFPVQVSLSDASGFTVATLTFTDPMYVNGSLPDGKYTLTVVSSEVTGGLIGGDHTIPFHCLFGDITGDGFTDLQDFVIFRQANGSQVGQSNFNPAFDSNGDGFIDNIDFIAFRQRIGFPL